MSRENPKDGLGQSAHAAYIEEYLKTKQQATYGFPLRMSSEVRQSTERSIPLPSSDAEAEAILSTRNSISQLTGDLPEHA